jgi:hypothetical protein
VLHTDRNRPVRGSIDPRLRSFEILLSRSIHSAEKAAEVSRECDDDHGHSLDGQAVSGQDLFWVLGHGKIWLLLGEAGERFAKHAILDEQKMLGVQVVPGFARAFHMEKNRIIGFRTTKFSCGPEKRFSSPTVATLRPDGNRFNTRNVIRM